MQKVAFLHSKNVQKVAKILMSSSIFIIITIDSSVKSISLNTYIKEIKPKHAIRISAKNFGFENNIKSIPLYAVFCIE